MQKRNMGSFVPDVRAEKQKVLQKLGRFVELMKNSDRNSKEVNRELFRWQWYAHNKNEHVTFPLT